MANLSLTIPRESVEFLPLDVKDGTTAVTAYETALVQITKRPTAWTPLVTVSGRKGLMVSSLTPGTYGIWVRVSGSPESVVIGPNDRDANGRLIGAGYIEIT